MNDINRVGGKNAALGEMISNLASSGIRVPSGVATTVEAYHEFLANNGLAHRIEQRLAGLAPDSVADLTAAGTEIRAWILTQELPPPLASAISDAYRVLEQTTDGELLVAVRSSATAEDLPDASFAGQQETFLNIHGIEHVLDAVRRVYASLYNDRAISYRVHQGFTHADVALSAGIQRMVRSDRGASGVMFTLDTESGFDQVVLITAAYGLGETVVQGAVDPDEFYVYKPALKAGRPSILRRKLGSKKIKMVFTEQRAAGKSVQVLDVPPETASRFSISDGEIQELARCAIAIEQHYGRPMDIEWGRDGVDGRIYILQARPETVRARENIANLQRQRLTARSEVLSSGRAIGQRIGSGVVQVIESPRDMERVRPGDVLVTDMTDPDWEPVMKRAAAIVTNRGGRTCHAAIIARELGVPAVVGCGDATEVLREGDEVTVSCAEGDTGFVYRGILATETTNIAFEAMPKLPLKIAMNIANPDLAFDLRRLPNDGVGLARLEFIIARMIGVHPKAALAPQDLPPAVRQAVEERSAGYANPVSFYVEKIVEGVATLGAAFWPKPVIVRLSDFKSNEYSSLIGGREYEPHEENPMLGFRGASRYLDPGFRDCFELECRALRKVRFEMGLSNVEIMVPFVRTLDEAREVVELLAQNGLVRGRDGLRVIMMCEIPSNAILAEQFLEYFDGYSIGSNDMTQLTLALDRDSSIIARRFDERDPAVKYLLHLAIAACRKAGKYVGICGQGPSDHPDLAQWLMQEGIGSLSLNPDTVVETWLHLGREVQAAAAAGVRDKK